MKSPAADNLLILGYGNPLRADDGAGVAVIERLAAMGATPPDPPVSVLTAHQLLPEHTDDLRRAARVVFIDASTRLPPGEVTFEPIAGTDADAAPLGHHLRPARLLGMCQAMYGRRPAAWQMAVGVESLGYGLALSPVVERAVESMANTLAAFIEQTHEQSHA